MLWVHEYLGQISHLDLAAQGALMRLSLICWITPGCRIPRNAAWIQRQLHVDRPTYNRDVRPVLKEFFQVEDGYWYSPDLRQEYAKGLAAHLRRADAGRKGGVATSLKHKGEEATQATSNASAAGQLGSSKQEPRTIFTPASKLALVQRIKGVLGPAASANVTDDDIERATSHWLGLGATEHEMVEVVRRQTATNRPKPIRSLRALDSEIEREIAKRNARGPSHSSAEMTPPEGAAGDCVRAVIDKHGLHEATAWLGAATWVGQEVIVANEFYRMRIESSFGPILHQHGFTVVVSSMQ